MEAVENFTPSEFNADQGLVTIPLDELVSLCAVDDELFYRTFFPKTFRQPSTPKHLEMDAAINDPTRRLINLRCFRGSAKTTRLRANVAKRIAYGVSRTILFVGASEPHAMRSIQWLRTQIRFNALYRDTFGLRFGRKENETELEVVSDKLQISCWVLGAGITGSIRGINFDDYRPDTIFLDDPLTDETAATHEQRQKSGELIHGAIKNSLAPKSEAPNAKLIMAQTPIARDDAADQALSDPEWRSVVFRCWTDETADLPIDQQESSWPERWSSEELRKDKRLAAQRNKLSTFLREMEVRLASAETSSFKASWLKFRTAPAPMMPNIIAIDPVPPPSERQLAKNLHDKDFEAISVIGREGKTYHLLDYAMNKGHEPNWTVDKIFGFYQRYRSLRLVFKPVGYERTLKYILEQEMKRRGLYIPVTTTVNSGLKKFHLIVNTIAPIASYGNFYIDPNMTDFIQQFQDYPAVAHDDLLDSVAVGLEDFVNPYLELSADEYREVTGEEDFEIEQRAP